MNFVLTLVDKIYVLRVVKISDNFTKLYWKIWVYNLILTTEQHFCNSYKYWVLD